MLPGCNLFSAKMFYCLVYVFVSKMMDIVDNSAAQRIFKSTYVYRILIRLKTNLKTCQHETDSISSVYKWYVWIELPVQL